MEFLLEQVLRKIILMSPLRTLYEEGLLRSWRLLFVNWFFQKCLGINNKTKWSVHYTSTVTNPDRITMGKGVRKSFAVSGGCYIQGGNGISIGDRTIFAPGVKIISANHDVESTARNWQYSKPIILGCDCWIGANAIILPGVELGDRVIVGAGSVVNKSFQSDLLIAGIPARVIRKLNETTIHMQDE